MSNENSSIHDFDFNLVCQYFSSIERQGPGSVEATLKALSFIDNLTENSKIADLGCGTGGQTITLAENLLGSITALDLFPIFIDQLNLKAINLGLEHRISGVVGSMDKLPFLFEELDLIWCEGAIYNVGFEKGIKLWRNYLKPGGYLAVTEASWFTEERPAEIDDFWMNAYPEIDTISNKLAQMQRNGYVPVATFCLPEYCWTKNFYDQQAKIQESFLQKHAGNATAESLIAYQKHEADLYAKYKAFYGYVFYIGRKI